MIGKRRSPTISQQVSCIAPHNKRSAGSCSDHAVAREATTVWRCAGHESWRRQRACSSRYVDAVLREMITAEGAIRWNADYVSLAEFIARMRQTRATADPESRVHVRAPGASYSAIAYVIEEARKAGIEHLTVEGSVTPDGKFPLWIF